MLYYFTVLSTTCLCGFIFFSSMYNADFPGSKECLFMDILFASPSYYGGINTLFSGSDLPNILCELFSAGLFEGIATISGYINVLYTSSLYFPP